MKKTNFKNFIIIIILISSILGSILTINALAYERPVFKDGLTAKWHPGSFCIPCHYSLMSTEKAKNISIGCFNCHKYTQKDSKGKYDVDMSKIFDIHKDIICIRCHIGTKDRKDVSAQDFHRIMPIDCQNCHNYVNGSYQVPEKTNCSDCHERGDPHIVHNKGDRLEKLCVACHGEEFANKYITGTVQINVSEQGIILLKQETKTTIEYPTIVQFLDKIIRTIIRID